MDKLKKLAMNIILVVVLVCSVIEFSGSTLVVSAEASVKTPYIKEKTITLYKGYQNYEVNITDLSKNAIVTYYSRNEKIASTDSKGVIQPVMEGSTIIYITIKQDSRVYHLNINVKVKKPSISFVKYTTYMNKGSVYGFTANAVGTDKEVEWKVSNPSVATISKTGVVTAISGGYIKVSAIAENISTTCKLRIGDKRLSTFDNQISCYKERKIWITAKDYITNEKLSATVDHPEVVSYTWGKDWSNGKISLALNPKSVGTATITIDSDKTYDQIVLKVNVTKKPENRKKLSAETIYKKCGPAMVELNCNNDDGSSLGSGFFIGNGTIVTNYHVIKGANKIIATTYNNKNYTVTDILGYDENLDIAILKTNCKNASITLSQENTAIGATVYTIGSPLGLTGTMTQGMVSTASRIIDNVNYIQMDAAISKGNSGGPLVNAYGEVIGINTMYFRLGNSLNFSININEIQKINMNNPMKISDYYDAYSKQQKEEFLASIIHEDPALSQDINICQQIPFDNGVDGKVETSEQGDYYTFYVDESGWFVAEMDFENKLDINNLNLSIFDNTLALKGKSLIDNDTKSQYLTCYLTPGQYYINISKTSSYGLTDVSYLFTTSLVPDDN